MKMMIAIMMLFLAANSVWAQPTVRTRATFVVRDDLGQPVPKALIEGGFYDVTDSGARDRDAWLRALRGCVAAAGPTCGSFATAAARHQGGSRGYRIHIHGAAGCQSRWGFECSPF